MNPTPILSVIIPTHHRNDLLAKCLDSLVPGFQTLSCEKYEVIVTDDGAESTAEEMIREHYNWAKWVAGPRKGPAANRNNGAKQALGQWLVFCDDDCIPDPQWLTAYDNAIRATTSCAVFEGRIYVDRPRQSLAEAAPISETGGYLWSANFACRKDVFDSLNGFDERFPYAAMEDVELRLRLTRAGYEFPFIKEASVCHPWRPKGGWKELKHHRESTLIYLNIHPEEPFKINAFYYLSATLKSFFFFTVYQGIKCKGRGTKQAILEHLYNIQTAFLLASKFGLLKSQHRAVSPKPPFY